LLWLAGTARNAIVVLLAMMVARIVAATDAGDEVFKLVRTIPSGVPRPENPLGSVSSSELSEVFTASIAISLLGYLESIAIAKSFAQKNGCAAHGVRDEARGSAPSGVPGAFAD
jgi:solute carrier family 26 (sodium-independent sulfate anion transporter), member 11